MILIERIKTVSFTFCCISGVILLRRIKESIFNGLAQWLKVYILGIFIFAFLPPTK